MEFLALSDIHGNITAVERLCKEVKNKKFDAIICAGDIGNSLESCREIVDIFSSLDAPFLYVLGNGDDFEFNKKIGNNAIHLHLNPFFVKNYVFLGYSGTAANYYGANPSLKEIKSGHIDYYKGLKIMSEARKIRRKELNEVVEKKGLDGKNIILISHERAGICNLDFTPIMHIFGHIHKKGFKICNGIPYLNVAELDDCDRTTKSYNKNGGFYCVIKLFKDDFKYKFYQIKKRYYKLYNLNYYDLFPTNSIHFDSK